MGFKGWILSTALVLSAFQAGAVEKENCVARAEMQDIASHFTQFRELADKGDYCFDGSQTSHLLAGIMFMRKTRFAADMPVSQDELFSGRFANNWYDYFIGRIHDFEVQDSCPKGVGAFVYFFGNTMYVCPMLLSENFTALDRASVFMHEARHIDGFPHMTCSRGARQGINGACDNRISEGGSYAVTVETYAQLAAYAGDLHPALRAYARSSAVVYADEAFDTPARVARSVHFMVMTRDQRFHTLKLAGESVETQELGRSPALGHIVLRGQHMILYPDDKSLPAKYVFVRDEGEIPQAAGDIAVEYNGQTPPERAELLDVHIGGQWSAKVYADHVNLACDPRSETKSDVSLNGEVAVSLIYPNGYDRGVLRAHLVTQSGKMFEVGCDNKRPYLRGADLVLDRSFKRVYKAGSDVVGLTHDGRLYSIVGSRSALLPVSFNGQVHELISSQTVDFLDR
jgi:hypothetical protein